MITNVGQLAALASNMMDASVITAAIKFRIPDTLSNGPKHLHELVQATQTQEEALSRLLKALVALGIVRETSPNLFEGTTLSQALVSRPNSVLPTLFKYWNDPIQVAAWSRLDETIRAGETIFPQISGGYSHFEYMRHHPDYAKVFHQAMAAFSQRMIPTILEAYDFNPYHSLVDIGGGNGKLMQAILERYPQASGRVFDLPEVVAQYKYAQGGELGERCTFEGGDFFETVPQHAEIYMLKNVLHDWGDEDCTRILRNIRQALEPGGRVLVIEHAMPTDHIPSRNTAMTNLSVLLFERAHSRQRSLPEFQQLFANSGLTLHNAIATTEQDFMIIEGYIQD